MKKFFFSLLMFLTTVSFGQQMPIMETREFPSQKFSTSKQVKLDKYEASVKIFGNIALTTVKLTFYNPSKFDLEGNLTFPLPDGVTVSGFALDINGKMRKAVPVEKEKATEVFESIERRKVDPGILEKVEGNNFRTRVYPLTANGYRTVEISYQQNLLYNKDELNYTMALPNINLSKFDLKVALYENATVPQLIEKPDGNFSFVKNGNVWTAQIQKSNYNPQKSLNISIPVKGNDPISLLQPAKTNSGEEEYYFATTVKVPNFNTKNVTAPNTVEIIWDNSLSRKNTDKQKEKAFLNAYFNWNKNVTVVLSSLNIQLKNQHTIQIKNGDTKALFNWIDNMVYDGGTDIGVLKNKIKQETFLFTDGLSTFGNLQFGLNEKLNVVVAASTADFGLMKYLSSTTNGQFINLNIGTTDQHLKAFTQNTIVLKGLISDDFVVTEKTLNSENLQEYVTIIGRVKNPNAKFDVLFSNNINEQKVAVNLSGVEKSDNWNLDLLWAQQKIASLELFYEQNKESIISLGKKYGLVTKGTSLIVLENVEDYVKYKITPPQELLQEYHAILKRKRKELQDNLTNYFETAAADMSELKKWWNKDFPLKLTINKSGDNDKIVISDSNVLYEGEDTPPPPPPFNATVKFTAPDMVRNEMVAGNAQEAATSEMKMVAGNRNELSTSNYKPSKGNVKVFDPVSDAKYMQSFNSDQNATSAYEVYLKLRNQNEYNPSFYFDVANYFYKNYGVEYGTLILSNLAELEIEDAELYKTIMYVLRKNKQNEKAYFIANKILYWRPFDPQSYRDCALILEDLNNHQEALSLIYKALSRDYTEETTIRDQGICETILMDMNHIINKGKNVNSKMINDNLKANLPVDIRVVLNWNFDNTDIDLHVIDPNGEVCFYSNNNTKIGGRLSNDFTDGFGPEQFLLKKAIKGKYLIKTNFYGENRVRNITPAVVMAEVFIRYGTSLEERQIVVFESKKENNSHDNDNLVLIGEFSFK